METPALTVPCIKEGCEQQVSRNANICPKCGTLQLPDRSHRPCRACGQPLLKAEHRYPVRHGLLISENHTPCPHCGEPQPLWSPADTLVQGLKMVFVVLAFVAMIAVMMIVSRNMREHRRLYRGHAYQGATGCGF